MSADLTSLFVHLLKWKKRTITSLRLPGDKSIESESNNFPHGKIFLAKIKKLIMVNSSLMSFGEGNSELQQSLFLNCSSE